MLKILHIYHFLKALIIAGIYMYEARSLNLKKKKKGNLEEKSH